MSGPLAARAETLPARTLLPGFGSGPGPAANSAGDISAADHGTARGAGFRGNPRNRSEWRNRTTAAPRASGAETGRLESQLNFSNHRRKRKLLVSQGTDRALYNHRR